MSEQSMWSRTRRLVVLLSTVAVIAGGSPVVAAASATNGAAAAGTAMHATGGAIAGGAVTVDSGPSSRSSCVAGAEACPIRIRFARGAYSGQAHARLTGIHDEKWFVVRARAGQQMIVVVMGAGATRGTVHFPNGQQDGQPGGRVFDDSLPVSGDYRIEVTESSMGEAWSGRVDVLVVIY